MNRTDLLSHFRGKLDEDTYERICSLCVIHLQWFKDYIGFLDRNISHNSIIANQWLNWLYSSLEGKYVVYESPLSKKSGTITSSGTFPIMDYRWSAHVLDLTILE